MEQIRHYQVVLPESVMVKLKKATGERYAKDAIARAIMHYLECPIAKKEKEEEKIKKPLPLTGTCWR